MKNRNIALFILSILIVLLSIANVYLYHKIFLHGDLNPLTIECTVIGKDLGYYDDMSVKYTVITIHYAINGIINETVIQIDKDRYDRIKVGDVFYLMVEGGEKNG